MQLKAVIFDYGMVLSGPMDEAAHAELLHRTGLPEAEFERRYWADRPAYDAGELTGKQYWQKITREAGLTLDEAAIDALNSWDARMWTTENGAMLAWHRVLKASGLRTAILSNMGDRVLECMEERFTWLQEFEVRVWSYQVRMAKPAAEIYLFVLNQLQLKPQEALFIDDRAENVAAARALGIRALQFAGIEALRVELVAEGLADGIPLPE